MTTPALLPSGLMDVLPPLAAAEFRLVHYFLKTFMAFGYQPVIPPLAEYASSMLAGQGEATGHHVFRMPDPLAPEMLALRADMTGQLARIAGTSLSQMPRPLRLCYAGYTLRTAPEALKTRRQHTQVGIERFGDMDTRSVAELLSIAAHALDGNGVSDITIDLHFPAVMEALLAEVSAEAQPAIREAARLKDIAQLRRLKAGLIADILETSGEAKRTLAKLATINHPAVAQAVAALDALVNALQAQQVAANVTVDMLDLSGYGYYTGIGYALYWNAANIEVGRGGCYRTGSGEDAVGFTLYINDLLEQLPAEAPAPIKTIPYGTPAKEAAALQTQGFVTVFK
ncbi:MAG: ATP phosphoribosyltransferase regulatory subunit [Pseudomonadota bacterium]